MIDKKFHTFSRKKKCYIYHIFIANPNWQVISIYRISVFTHSYLLLLSIYANNMNVLHTTMTER